MYMVDYDKFMYQIYVDQLVSRFGHAFVDVHCDCEIHMISNFQKIRLRPPAFRSIVANDKPKTSQ